MLLPSGSVASLWVAFTRRRVSAPSSRGPASAAPRLIAAVLLVALVLLVAGCAGPGQTVPAGEVERAGEVSDRPSAAAVAEGATAPPAARFAASDVLREWDRARSRAFAAGDAAALRELYVTGSSAGRADVGLLRGYQRRGLRVTGMEVQLLAVEVLHESTRRLRLRVTDRLTGAVAVARDGTLTRLPTDTASTRVVELVRGAGSRWRVSSVRA